MRTTPLAILTLTLLLAPATRALAQAESPADLRREIDTLRNRVAQLEAANDQLQRDLPPLRRRTAQLEAQLARVQAEAARLRDENDALERQLREHGLVPAVPGSDSTGADSPTPPSSETAELPSDPMACPASLLVALTRDYDDRFADRSLDPRARAEYVRDVRRWTLDVKREFRNRVTWTVEIDPSSVPGDDNLPVRLRVVDPDSRRPYHTDTVSIDLGSRNTRRIMTDPDRRYWALDALFFADPGVNPDRESAGSLDYPPFIGPFAEFGYGLSVRSLTPAKAP